MSCPVDKLIAKYKPEWVTGDQYVWEEPIVKSFDRLSLAKEVTGHAGINVQPNQVLHYESDAADEDDLNHAAKKSVSRLKVRRAQHPNPKTGGYPCHCPIERCRQRFADTGLCRRHMLAVMHNVDRKGRSDKQMKDLVTEDDYCARSDVMDFHVYCVFCEQLEEAKGKPEYRDGRKGHKRVKSDV